MTLDNNSKHGVLIGIIHVIGYLIYAMYPLKVIIARMGRNDDSDFYVPSVHFEDIISSILLASMAILSGLLVIGIIKKRHLFISPWLIGSLAVLALSVGHFVILFCSLSIRLDFGLEINFYMIGMQILVIYPIRNLYHNIRDDTKKTIYSKNIMSATCIKQDAYVPFDNNQEKDGKGDMMAPKLEI